MQNLAEAAPEIEQTFPSYSDEIVLNTIISNNLDGSANHFISNPRLDCESRHVKATYSTSEEVIEIDLGNQLTATEESPLPQANLVLAATLVSDAKSGRASNFIFTEEAVKLYRIYNHWGFSYLLYFFIVLHHLVAVCEDPAVPGYHLPFWATMIIEFVCLVYYIIRLVHSMTFLPTETFLHDKKNILVFVAVLLTAIDMACYIGLLQAGHETFAYRWSRPLRPIFIVNFSECKQIRRAFRNIRKTLPDILNVLVLFILSISLFSLMAQKLFEKRYLKFPDGTPYFTNYLDIFFQLYVLVTTSNNPDIMMPAYDSNRWFALFFITYIIICLYIFMNIFLAVIYNNYRKHLKLLT